MGTRKASTKKLTLGILENLSVDKINCNILVRRLPTTLPWARVAIPIPESLHIEAVRTGWF